jgi:hypothetical protein
MASESDKFIEYISKADRIKHYMRVVASCRILGLKSDQITVDPALKEQLASPGVHSTLGKEMKAAHDNIIKWIQENPEWKQIPRM